MKEKKGKEDKRCNTFILSYFLPFSSIYKIKMCKTKNMVMWFGRNSMDMDKPASPDA